MDNSTSNDSIEGSSPFPSYYSDLAGRQYLTPKLRNLDDSKHFDECRQRLMDEASRNFVVDFGDEDAWCAFNLESNDFSTLLNAPRPKSLETRWINIWAPEHQNDIIRTIASQFQISARLQSVICDDPSTTQRITAVSPKLTSDRPSIDQTYEMSAQPEIEDIEEQLPYNKGIPGGIPLPRTENGSDLKSISFSQIVNQIWHFFSVDYGQKYTCIGYNSVYTVPDGHFENEPGQPDGKRVWSWLFLCDDGTVVSIQENPFPHSDRVPAATKQAALKVVRRNVALIFSALSKHRDVSKGRNPLMTTHVRNLSSESGKATVNPGEAPSLLFYYIFDDWVTNYSLVIRKEPSYRAALEKLRREMMVSRPRVEVIHDVHQLGRQLGVLKRLYQSYELITTRILSRQRLLMERTRSDTQLSSPIRPRGRFPYDAHMRTDSIRSLSYDDFSAASLGGVPLSPAALGRFERLADRVRQYALSEIEECLIEKESLTFLVFNLIAVKDSQAVERLTRITILLAKATILFLPVSLMTGYFSTEIKELQNYTGTTYWASFAVIVSLSIILLSLFGLISDTVEGKPIYRSIGKTFFDASKRALVRKKKQGHH